MAWQGGKQLSQLLNSLAMLNSAGNGRPGNWNKRNRGSSSPQDKPRKDMAGTFWNCGTCGTECFACKNARGNAKIQKTGGQSLKPGAPARKPGTPATQARQPPTRSGSNGPAAMDSLLTEQTLRKQIKAAMDDPVLTEILEKALSNLTNSKQQALPLKDQRAKLMAEAKQWAEKVDKQTKVIEEAVEKRAAFKEEL
eukprot:6490785-Amphidinium_carterae.1